MAYIDSPTKIQIVQTPDLEIEILDTVAIITPDIVPQTFHNLFRYRDGRIVLSGTGAGIKSEWATLSSDGGRTWVAVDYGPRNNSYEFDDGSVLELVWAIQTDVEQAGWYHTKTYRYAPDGSRTEGTCRVNIPDGSETIVGDDGKPESWTGVFDRGIVRLPDGSLLAAAYGTFKTDTERNPLYTFPMYKLRSWVVCSVDEGQSWDYLSTVASGPVIGDDGFCEPALIALRNGNLLCFMRTGGGNPQHPGPMYLACSDDAGLSWSTPIPIADRGVWPNACELENGVIAVTYGRPGNWLTFSTDGGASWQGHLCFSCDPGSHYNNIAVVGKEEFLVTYYREVFTWPGQKPVSTEIIGTRFAVRRR